MKRSAPPPVWTRPTGYALKQDPVSGAEQADLAIIGGGFLGLSAALHAARRGLSVRVVEAGRIGDGASGLNGGQVIPGLKLEPEQIIERFGQARGERLVGFVSTLADRVFDTIAREQLDVDHARNGWIYACHTRAALDFAAERDRQWRDLGADVSLLDRAEIARLTGAEGYLGGWIDRRGGVINPLAFISELARVCAAAGVRIAENERATSLRRDGGGWRIALSSGGEVQASMVIVGANAYSDGLIPGLARSIVPLHSFQIATARLAPEQLAATLPGGQSVSDSRRIVIYYRRTADGRLALGGRGSMAEPTAEADWGHLDRALGRLYPALAGTTIERRWFGRVAMTPDHLPHIHEPEARLVTAVGCQGRGVGLMTALGPELVDYLVDRDPERLPFPLSPIRPIPLHGFRALGVAAAIAWYRTLDAIER
ncbi:MAG TPA: FAD-binding oxidoreductase [Hansschlegelia sp.]